jgi:PIF1-like helicase
MVERNRRATDQLICFLHGPAGCGKTTVIDLIIEYAREYCSYMENYQLTSRTIVVTAMTGIAATLLLGETTHSAVYLNQRRPIEPQQVEAWESTRLLIIDEISFASKLEFETLDTNLGHLKQQKSLPYGGLNIVFAGDMRQLEPVNKHAVYLDDCPQFKDWVNCYIELKGMHRFKHDLEWGRLLTRFRNGQITASDIDSINTQVVNAATNLPENIKYATFKNSDREAINAALFQERCNNVFVENGSVKDSIMIFSDELEIQNGSRTYIPLMNCKPFWQNCGEDNIETSRSGRMDPVLKLYRGCRVMLTSNTNVKAGQANGTQATVINIVLKPDVLPQNITLCTTNYTIYAVLASQVSHIVLQHSNERVQPQTFSLQPRKYTFEASILKPRKLQFRNNERETVKMRGTQLPVIINNASTGHKLQGTGVDNLFVHNWQYQTNWPYVMLSRVKTKSGCKEC